jgi:hypothetical protein
MSSSLISWSTHPYIHNKPPEWEPRFGSGWLRKEGTLQDLVNDIHSGKAFIPAAMTSHHRTAAAFEFTDLVAVDIDHGLSIEELQQHPLAQHACFAYSTPSHVDEPGKHRFRVLFRLGDRISSGDVAKAIVTILTHALGGDRSCTDPTRLFYGNSKGETLLLDHEAVLPGEIIDDAEAYLESQRAACRDAASDVDEASILRGIHVLEKVLEPTRDGERDLFVRISAAAKAGGDALFPAWSDWASRGHHGSGARRRQSSERWFQGLRGTSLGTLFFLASEQDPDWRSGLPEELRNYDLAPRGFSDTYAGYSASDFMGDPDVTPPTRPTASLFDPSAPWAKRAEVTFAGHSEEDFNGEPMPSGEAPKEDSGEPKKRGPGRPKKDDGDKADIVTVVMTRLSNLYPGIRRNLITDQIEFGPRDNPQQLPDSSTTYIRISRGTKELYPKTMVNDLIQVLGYENRYNPVRSYLENCLSRVQPCPYFNSLATELLGVDGDDLDNPVLANGQHVADAILERFFIGAVARAMEPGCDMPWMPILVGPQNAGKSAFFRYITPPQLSGPSWSTTVQQGISHIKDRPHILHAGWIVVIDEVERYFSRRYVEELKNLISVSQDYSAKKYQNEAHYPRNFVLAGATNNRDFLVDPTGNRRFMPIVVKGKIPSRENPDIRVIDLDRLQADRDAIWAAAYQAYLAGRPRLLSSSELSEVESYVEGFTRDSSIAIHVSRALERGITGVHDGRRFILLADVLGAMGIDVKDYGRIQGEVIDSMKQLGWAPKRIRIFGKVTRVWLGPKVETSSLYSHGNPLSGTTASKYLAAQRVSEAPQVSVSSRPGWD